MKIVGHDWAAPGEGCIFADENGATPYLKGTLHYLQNEEPCVIALEKTAGSYPRGSREGYIRVAAQRGFKLFAIDPRVVSNMRRTLGIEKTNENDAKLIRKLYLERPELFRPFKVLDLPDNVSRNEQLNEARQAAKEEIVIARENAWKNDFSARTISLIGTKVPEGLDDLEDIVWEWKGRGRARARTWRPQQVVPPICFASQALLRKRGRKWFGAMCGLHTDGYKNIIRSQAHFHALSSYMRKHLSEEGLANLDAQIKANRARKEWLEKGKKGTPPAMVADTAEQILVRHKGKRLIAFAYDLVFRLVRDRVAAQPIAEAA